MSSRERHLRRFAWRRRLAMLGGIAVGMFGGSQIMALFDTAPWHPPSPHVAVAEQPVPDVATMPPSGSAVLLIVPGTRHESLGELAPGAYWVDTTTGVTTHWTATFEEREWTDFRVLADAVVGLRRDFETRDWKVDTWSRDGTLTTAIVPSPFGASADAQPGFTSGGRLAWLLDDGSECLLRPRVWTPDATSASTLTSLRRRVRQSAWASDASSVLYAAPCSLVRACDAAEERRMCLWSAPPSGGESAMIWGDRDPAPYEERSFSRLAVSPDGARAWTLLEASELRVHDLATRRATVIAHPLAASVVGFPTWTDVAWSPDGSTLAVLTAIDFGCDDNDGCFEGIHLIAADGSSTRRLGDRFVRRGRLAWGN